MLNKSLRYDTLMVDDEKSVALAREILRIAGKC
jgi:hypothetical protein